MTAIFAMIACAAFDAEWYWYVAGLMCAGYDADRIAALIQVDLNEP